MTPSIAPPKSANLPARAAVGGRKNWEGNCGAAVALVTFLVGATSVINDLGKAMGGWQGWPMPALPMEAAVWTLGFSGGLFLWLSGWMRATVWRRVLWGFLIFLSAHWAWVVWSTGETMVQSGWKSDLLANLWESKLGPPLLIGFNFLLCLSGLVMVSAHRPESRAYRFSGLVGLGVGGVAAYFWFEQFLSPHVWHAHGLWTEETLGLMLIALPGLSIGCAGGWTRGVVWAVMEMGYIIRHDRKDTSIWLGRVVLVLLVSGLLGMGWVGVRYLKEGFQRERQLAEENLQQVAELVVDAVEVWQRERIYDTRVLAHSPTARMLVRNETSLANPAVRASLRQSLELWHLSYGYDEVVFYNAARHPVWSTPEGLNAPLRAGLEVRGSDGEVEWASANATSDDLLQLVYLAPVDDEDGKPIGWLRLSISARRAFSALSASEVARARGMHTWFTRRQGDRVYVVEPGQSRERLVAADSLLYEISDQATPGRLHIGTDETGSVLMAIITPLAGNPWNMVTGSNVEEVVYQMRQRAWHARTTALLIIGLVLVTTWTMMRRRRDLFRLQDLFNKEHELNTMKTRFISVASHEFRTPVTVAMGSIELLENHRDNLTADKQQELLTRVRSSLKRITAMLDDILTLSRLDVRKTEAKIKPVNLVSFTKDVVSEVQLVDGDRHRIPVEFDGELSDVATDPVLLRHILQNLVENAVHYSPADTEVRVSVRRETDALVFVVRDHGRGIPEKDVERIFAPFERGSNSEDTRGTGLGLNIVNRMAALLGGKVEVESVLDMGSVFTVRLPLEVPTDPPDAESESSVPAEPHSPDL